MYKVLDIKTRAQFRRWLGENATKENECWVQCKRGSKTAQNVLWYLDAVEEALCFGWIDSTVKTIDGVYCQRFAPRRKGSNWTELNKERCRRLIKLGLMTDAGLAVLPDLDAPMVVPSHILLEFKANEMAWNNFEHFPSLYKRVRLDNVCSYTARHVWKERLAKLISASERNVMIGQWDDYGRLSNWELE